MRHISKLKKKRIEEREGFDSLLQLWFNYHFLFFHCLIFRGLKLKAFSFFLNIKSNLKKFEFFDPSFVFFIGVLKITPCLITKPFNFGGTSYDVAFPLNYWKRIAFGCKWAIKLSKESRKSFTVNGIVNALIDSLYNEGVVYEKKMIMYLNAGSNRNLLRNRIFKR